MRALKIDDVGRTSFHDIPAPRPGPEEVLLAVRHVGLCGSDMATFTGANPLVSLPRIPGHELGCEIVEAGAAVPPAFSPGHRAIVIPYTTCGACSSCRRGRFNACRFNRTLGVQQDGGLAEQIVVHHSKLILNDRLAPRHLALVEPLSVGFHAVARGRVGPDDHVVVLGCGMIGMGAIAGAAARGARVTAVDVGVAKQALARAWGAAETIDAAAEDVAARVAALTDGHGADVVIEAVGLPLTFRQAVDIACFSGRIVYIGYSKAEVAYDTKLFNLKELDIMGSRNALREDFDAVISFLETTERNPDDLITQVVPFDRAEEALSWWRDHRATTLKVVIER
ncbi:zinc-binding alcohol dehydrogenase family protein [Alsobacter sp. R-9]